MKIILFDIDGTLVKTDGSGLAAMNRAFQELFGLKDALDGTSIAGCTDSSITRNVFERFQIPWHSNHVDAIKNLYFSYLQEELEIDNRNKYLLPGFPCLLKALRKCPGVHLGLLTGNWQQGAEIKLSYFDLWEYFAFGAFGDDHHDRNELLPFALQRFQATHRSSINHHCVFVIGDTPRDVQCGRPYSAVTIAVATGPYSRERLSEEDPHYVFDNLADVGDFLDIVQNHRLGDYPLSHHQ